MGKVIEKQSRIHAEGGRGGGAEVGREAWEGPVQVLLALRRS